MNFTDTVKYPTLLVRTPNDVENVGESMENRGDYDSNNSSPAMKLSPLRSVISFCHQEAINRSCDTSCGPGDSKVNSRQLFNSLAWESGVWHIGLWVYWVPSLQSMISTKDGWAQRLTCCAWASLDVTQRLWSGDLPIPSSRRLGGGIEVTKEPGGYVLFSNLGLKPIVICLWEEFQFLTGSRVASFHVENKDLRWKQKIHPAGDCTEPEIYI